MNAKVDIVVPLLMASEQLLKVARALDSHPIYHIIDSIDQQVIRTYGIELDKLTSEEADAVNEIIYEYRNEEHSISECLTQLEEFSTLKFLSVDRQVMP